MSDRQKYQRNPRLITEKARRRDDPWTRGIMMMQASATAHQNGALNRSITAELSIQSTQRSVGLRQALIQNAGRPGRRTLAAPFGPDHDRFTGLGQRFQ